MTGLKQAHVEIKTDRSDGLQAIKKVADGFMRTVAESWIFAGKFRFLRCFLFLQWLTLAPAGTDFQILTQRSGFGKIRTSPPLPSAPRSSLTLSCTATWLRGKEGTTIALFNEGTDPEFTAQYKAANEGRLPPPIDCSKPEACVPFSPL